MNPGENLMKAPENFDTNRICRYSVELRIRRKMSVKYGDVVEVDVGGVGVDVQASDVLARREAVAHLCVGDEPPLVTVYF